MDVILSEKLDQALLKVGGGGLCGGRGLLILKRRPIFPSLYQGPGLRKGTGQAPGFAQIRIQVGRGTNSHMGKNFSA